MSLSQFLAMDQPAIIFTKIVLAMELISTVIVCWMVFIKYYYFRVITSFFILISWPLLAVFGFMNSFPGLEDILAKAFFAWITWGTIWIIYLNRSYRVRVTFEHQVPM